ncbi:MAG: carbamoyl-phosphate synthase large subunit, partial [Proteobacteria bacterium]|nr:carbamoyl-phosphate synthase large subunit [Pseudomonadota bacterium]
STDYDTSDRLYFEPLTKEDVLGIIEAERPFGVIVQFGGQTPLNLSVPLAEAGAPIIGTPPDAIDRAEDRKRFQDLIQKLGLTQPDNDTAFTADEAAVAAERIGYPVIVRPSYVLGGRGMEIVFDRPSLERYVASAARVSPDHPILIDHFLEEAVEVDVDAICDGSQTIVAGVMEHIEQAGIHSGDSACVLPPHTLDQGIIDEIMAATRAMAAELGVVGLMNVQYAVKDGRVFVLEVNPRASRTIPFVSKATGVPWAKVATKVMMGLSLEAQGLRGEVRPKHYSVKEAVFPFARFPGVDAMLGPEMRSTGEVMGLDADLGAAYAKSQLAAGQILPTKGQVFVSVRDPDKAASVEISRRLEALGFQILATAGTAAFLLESGVHCRRVNKIGEPRPNVVDHILNGEVQLVINTSTGKGPQSDAARIRRAAVDRAIPYVTTVAGAMATVGGIEALGDRELDVRSLQEYHQAIEGRPNLG